MPEVFWGYNVNVETTGYYASFFSHFDAYTFGYSGKSMTMSNQSERNNFFI